MEFQVSVDVQELVEGFIAAMLFADSPEESQGEWGEENLTPESKQFVIAFCHLFAARAGHLFKEFGDLSNDDLNHVQSIGADLYYTKVGHGLGFDCESQYSEYRTYLEFVTNDLPHLEVDFCEESKTVYVN